MAYVLRRACRKARIHHLSGGQAGRATYRHADARDELWNARARMSRVRARAAAAAAGRSQGRARQRARAGAHRRSAERGDLSWWAVDHDRCSSTSPTPASRRPPSRCRRSRSAIRRTPSSIAAVRWLMVNRRGGYWSSTKQTAMALYGLLGFMQARGETAAAVQRRCLCERRARPVNAQLHRGAMTAPDPVVVTAPAREGANSIRLKKRDGGTVYWSAAAAYYDPSTARRRAAARVNLPYRASTRRSPPSPCGSHRLS